jgi:hypothetical protein
MSAPEASTDGDATLPPVVRWQGFRPVAADHHLVRLSQDASCYHYRRCGATSDVYEDVPLAEAEAEGYGPCNSCTSTGLAALCDSADEATVWRVVLDEVLPEPVETLIKTAGSSQRVMHIAHPEPERAPEEHAVARCRFTPAGCELQRGLIKPRSAYPDGWHKLCRSCIRHVYTEAGITDFAAVAASLGVDPTPVEVTLS